MRSLEPVLVSAAIPSGGAWTMLDATGLPPEGRYVVMLGTEGAGVIRFRLRLGVITLIEDAIDGVNSHGFFFQHPELILEFQNNGLPVLNACAQYTTHL